MNAKELTYSKKLESVYNDAQESISKTLQVLRDAIISTMIELDELHNKTEVTFDSRVIKGIIYIPKDEEIIVRFRTMESKLEEVDSYPFLSYIYENLRDKFYSI